MATTKCDPGHLRHHLRLPLSFVAVEGSRAQPPIPMAISLGYGILFATVVTLFLVPINCLIVEDIKSLYRQEK